MSNAVCAHLDQILVRELPPSVPGCEDCLRIGGKWLHLRICLTCSHVGCCDDSPNHHASAHAHATSHPIIRSLEQGEDWNWCYVDEVTFLVDGIRGTTRIPPSPLLQ
jgi:Zn-finger in ubiquitin-hydrolases and other protein